MPIGQSPDTDRLLAPVSARLEVSSAAPAVRRRASPSTQKPSVAAAGAAGRHQPFE